MQNTQEIDRELIMFISEKIAVVHIAKRHRNVYN